MKKFLLIDDHQVVRSGITALLSQLFPSPEVHEAWNADTAIEKLKQHDYDLVVMDVQIPGSDMQGLMKFIQTEHPNTRVLVFSMSAENVYAKRFLTAGARGFLSKDAGFDEVKKAINMVLNDRRYISENLAQTFAGDAMAGTPTNPFARLSNREFEILTILLCGQPQTDACKTLNLASSSVGTYKKRIFQKLGVKTLLELSELATAYDLVRKN